MKALLIGLFVTVSPAIAGELKDPSIEHGGLYFTDPQLTMSYAMSRTDATAFALAVTTSNQVEAENGLEQEQRKQLREIRETLQSIEDGSKQAIDV